MKSISCAPGTVRTVDRDNVYEDVIEMYRTDDIVAEYPIKIQYSDEQAYDDGGVQRDMYSAFWDEAYLKLFEGATSLIPMVHPQMDLTVFPILARILSHGYLVCGHFPVRIALPTLIAMILGPGVNIDSQIMLDAFLDYISETERSTFRDAIKCKARFSAGVQSALLDVLSRFGCRVLPTRENLLSTIQNVSNYEFLAKPAAAIALIYSGIPKNHNDFWQNQSVNDLCSIFNQLTVTSEKVLKMLAPPEAKSISETRIYGYLVLMIGNMNTDDLRSLLRFTTGSSVCTTKYIFINFNGLTGLARRPIAHTCSSTLEIPTSYVNFEDFLGDFQSIISKTNREFSFRMDAI